MGVSSYFNPTSINEQLAAITQQPLTKTFIANAGQTVFDFRQTGSYVLGLNRIDSVIVGGVTQPVNAYSETSIYSITMTSGVPKDASVIITWRGTAYDSANPPPLVYVNKLINGDFISPVTTGWTGTGTLSASTDGDGDTTAAQIAGAALTYSRITSALVTATLGYKYYVRVRVKRVNNTVATLRTSNADQGTFYNTINHTHVGDGYETISCITTPTLNVTGLKMLLYPGLETASDNKTALFDKAMIVCLNDYDLQAKDLTWCDANLPFVA